MKNIKLIFVFSMFSALNTFAQNVNSRPLKTSLSTVIQ